MTNHPQWGGTHLPDITIVTPVFDPSDDTKVLFYCASRGHHSDIVRLPLQFSHPSSAPCS